MPAAYHHQLVGVIGAFKAMENVQMTGGRSMPRTSSASTSEYNAFMYLKFGFATSEA